MTEKDLNIYDVWQSPNGNLFIKIGDNYAIGIGQKGHHEPTNDKEGAPFVKINGDFPVKKVGKIIFD